MNMEESDPGLASANNKRKQKQAEKKITIKDEKTTEKLRKVNSKVLLEESYGNDCDDYSPEDSDDSVEEKKARKDGGSKQCKI